MKCPKIHACLTLPLSEVKKIPEHRINIVAHYKLDFNSDSSFFFVDENKYMRSSKFLIKDSAVIFLDRLDRKMYKFEIDSITQDRVFLLGNYIMFYSISNDKIEYFTSEGTRIILKKI